MVLICVEANWLAIGSLSICNGCTWLWVTCIATSNNNYTTNLILKGMYISITDVYKVHNYIV